MSVNKLLTSINTKAGIQQDQTPGTLRLSVSSENYYCYSAEIIPKQECIPVGCIPSATVAVCSLGSALGRGGGLLQGGVSAPGERGVPAPRGSAPGGVCS